MTIKWTQQDVIRKFQEAMQGQPAEPLDRRAVLQGVLNKRPASPTQPSRPDSQVTLERLIGKERKL